MITRGMYTSSTDKWETPQKLFDKLNRIFCFELDACADETNHKCERYYSEHDDGLQKSWGGVQDMVQSALWETDRQMDQKSCGHGNGRSVVRCDVTASKNRHRMVSRVYSYEPEGTCSVSAWEAKVWWEQSQRAVSEHDRSLCIRGWKAEQMTIEDWMPEACPHEGEDIDMAEHMNPPEGGEDDAN